MTTRDRRNGKQRKIVPIRKTKPGKLLIFYVLKIWQRAVQNIGAL
jgi:hypothetical protein